MIDGVVRSLEPRSDIVRLLCQKDALTAVLRMEWRCARQKQQGDHLSETTAASPANSSGDWDRSLMLRGVPPPTQKKKPLHSSDGETNTKQNKNEQDNKLWISGRKKIKWSNFIKCDRVL